MKNTTLIIALAISYLGVAQNFSSGTATLENGNSLTGKMEINNATATLLVKNGLNIASYDLGRVSQAQIGNKTYNNLKIGEATYLASSLNENNSKATLYKIGPNDYLISNNSTQKSFNTKTDQNIIPGILSLLYNDCNDIRATIEKKSRFKEEELIEITQQYNNCSYSDYAPTEREIAQASKHNTDKASIYGGIGGNLNNVSFRNNDDTEGLLGGQLRIGVIASPAFLNNLQGNLFFFLEGTANFTGDKDFSNNTSPVNFSVNSYRAQLGFEYLFNKKGSLKPIIGVGFGATSDSFSGSILGNSFDIDGGNPFIAPRLGVRFKLKNDKHIGIMAEYISSYDNDLTFPTQDGIIPLEVSSQNIGIGINYYF